jgi:hypothetical protein
VFKLKSCRLKRISKVVTAVKKGLPEFASSHMNEFSQAAANNVKKIRQKLSISAAFRN